MLCREEFFQATDDCLFMTTLNDILNLLLPDDLTHAGFKLTDRFDRQHILGLVLVALCMLAVNANMGQAGIGTIYKAKVSNHDFSQQYTEHFTLSTDISTRDRDGINKTFSGLMKILFPHEGATVDEIEEVLKFSIEGRRRVKDQLFRIDDTYPPVRFEYIKKDDHKVLVKTLEQKQYPQHYNAQDESDIDNETVEPEQMVTLDSKATAEPVLKEQHLTFQENQKGISFDTLFGPYLKGATEITITDPYIRQFYQARNMMELLELISNTKLDEDEVNVHLITCRDDFKGDQQEEYFGKMQNSCEGVGIHFTWECVEGNTIHARHIVTDHGWKILLDRGLDVYQPYEMNDSFMISNRLQKYRATKAFEITFLRNTNDGK